MSRTQQQPPSVVPFCIYHWTDTTTNVYRSLLLRAEGIVDSEKGDGKIEHHCLIPQPGGPHGRWSLVSQFYSVNPAMTPIPSGMILFCAKYRSEWPWDTISVDPVYDLFDQLTARHCVFFIAYSKPAPGTVPLYIYSKGSGSSISPANKAFISYSPEPPPHDDHSPQPPGVREPREGGALTAQDLTPRQIQISSDDLESVVDDVAWGMATISPIFVMSPKTFGPDSQAIKFVCNVGTCLPWSPAIEKADIYWAGKARDKEPKPLYECAVDCNQLVPSPKDKRLPFSLFLDIQERADRLGKSPPVPNFFKKSSSLVVGVVIGLLVLATFIVGYLVLSRKK